MNQEVNKIENQDLSPVVRAIGSDLEHTQVRLITSANPVEVLKEMAKVDNLLKIPTVKKVLGLTNELNQLVQQPVALFQDIDNWYITQAVANGWSRNVLQMQIETGLFARQITDKKE